MDKKYEGSNMPVKSDSVSVIASQIAITPSKDVKAGGTPLGLDTGWSATIRGCGVIHLNINCPIIHAGSTVLISLSEFSDVNNPAGSRFVGAARFAIYNISPREGGVVIWAEVSWSNPINIYFGILVN